MRISKRKIYKESKEYDVKFNTIECNKEEA